MSIATQHVGLTTKLSVRVLRDGNELRGIRDEWLKLYHRSEKSTPFQHPEWMLAWVEAWGPHELLFIEAREGAGLVAVAPLLIYPRNGQRILAFAGGGVSDYLDWLCEPGYENPAVSSVVQFVAGLDWTLLELTDLPAHSSLLRLSLFESQIQEHDLCSVLSLPPTEDELLHAFSKRQRANLRNARSRLQREGGGIVETATEGEVTEFLDDLFRLHTSRWAQSGEPGVVHDEAIRNFHRICGPPLVAEGAVKIHRLRLGGETIAIVHSMWHGETAFCYLQGFDPRHSSLGPGTQLMFKVIDDARCHGIRRFDFLRGQEEYKQHWRAQPQSTYRITMSKARIRERFASTNLQF